MVKEGKKGIGERVNKECIVKRRGTRRNRKGRDDKMKGGKKGRGKRDR